MTYHVSGLNSGFLGSFDGMVSVNDVEKIINEKNFSRPFQRFIICHSYQKFRYWYTKFRGLFLGFFGLSMVRFQVMFLKISSLNRAFQDLSHGTLYFPVAQIFINFVIFTCLRIFGNYLDLRNREIWKFLGKYGKIWKFY